MAALLAVAFLSSSCAAYYMRRNAVPLFEEEFSCKDFSARVARAEYIRGKYGATKYKAWIVGCGAQAVYICLDTFPVFCKQVLHPEAER